MIITELYIRGFGKLKNLNLFPTDGFNVIFGENESGKSTLMTFIRACFYGVGGKNDLREKYRPHDGSPMSGYIVFEHNGVCYKLDRSFGMTASKDTTELWNTGTGIQEKLPAKTSVGEYLFAINESTFVSTVYIGQTGMLMDKNNDEILKKLNNLTTSNDADISYTEVSERLSCAVKKLKSRSQESTLNKLSNENQSLKEKEFKLNNKCSALSAQIENLSENKKQLDRINTEIRTAEKAREFSFINEKKKKLENICMAFERFEYSEFLLKETKKKILFNEKTVTHEDIREISGKINHTKALDAETGRLFENLSIIEGRKKELQNSFTENNEILENIENIRKLDILYNDKSAENKFNNSKKSVGFNTITLILSLIILISGILVYKKFGILSIIIGVVSALIVFLIGCSVKVKPKIKYKEELENQNRRFLEDCHCNSIDELFSKASKIQNDKLQLNAVELQFNKVKKLISDKKHEIALADNEIDGFLNNFKDSYPDLETTELLNAIGNDIKAFEEAEHKTLYCKNELERLNENRNIDDIKAELEKTQQILTEHPEFSSENTPEYYNNLITSLNSQKNNISEKVALLSITERELSETQKLLAENKKLIDENEGKLEKASEELLALETAIDVFEQSFEEMQKNFSPIVNKKTGEILSALTGGKYSDIYISKKLSPAVNAPEDSRLYETKNFSGGTVDQIYLSLRLAIADVILDGLSMPVMLDDSFSQFDNTRMQSAVEYIFNTRSQVFMFTCRQEDAKTAGNLGANMIKL